MSVTEYLDKFTHLSRYAPDEVNTDLKRQERFLDGLIGPLNYQLQNHTFPDFQTLLNKEIGLESKRKELGEQKRKFQSHGQSSSYTRPRFSSQQSPSQYRPGGQGGRYPQNLQLQRSFQPQRFNPQTPRAPTPQQSRYNNGSGAPVRNTTPIHPNGCFKCGQLRHYANNCPKRAVQTPQRDNSHRSGQSSSQPHTPQSLCKRGQQNYVRGRVNHVSVEQAQNDSGVVLGTFLVNSIPATVLFDSGASHSFITDQFVTKHNLSMSSMKNLLIVSSLGGEMKLVIYAHKINIMGVDFLANLVVLKSWGIDVIL
jgi:hypothetical protein